MDCSVVSGGALGRSLKTYGIGIGVEVRPHGRNLICVLDGLVHYADHSNVSHVVIRVNLVCEPP